MSLAALRTAPGLVAEAGDRGQPSPALPMRLEVT